METTKTDVVHSNGVHPREKQKKTVVDKEPLLYEVINEVFTFISCILFYLLLPILLPISLCFRIYRSQLQKKLLKRNGDELHFMAGNDAMFQADTQENRMVINALLTMRGKLIIQDHQDIANERMVNNMNEDGERSFPKMSQYANQLLSRDVWMEDKNFKIEDHVFIHPEIAPEDKRELGTMVGDICSRPLPACKSPWQIIYLRTHEPDLTIIIFKVHHIIADGISLVKVVTTCFTDSVPNVSFAAKRFGTKKDWKRIAKIFYLGPSILLKRLVWPADNTLLHGAKLSGQKLVMWSDPISLKLIKDIKNATGTTVNDVVMSCLAGAFRNYFLKHQSEMPSDLSAYIPVDIRSPTGKLILDNQFGLVFLSLPLSSNDSIETLMKTRDRMDAIKSSPEPIINNLLIRYLMARLPKWLASTFLNWMARKCSVVLSNVPGPSEHLTLLDNKLEDIMFWPPAMGNVGLGVSIFSYAGNVRIGVMSDKNILTNPTLLIQEFVNKVNDLAKDLELV